MTQTDLIRQQRIGLELPEGLTIEEWEVAGRQVVLAIEGGMWWLGDWWRYGSHRYGSRARSVAEGVVGRAFQTCMDAGWIAGRFETSRRREVLSWSHHREVAGLDPDEADALLDQAEADGWSRQQLRSVVKAKQRRSKTDRLLSVAVDEVDSDVIQDDCLDFLAKIPDGTVSLLLTDPPYAVTENEWDVWETETAYWDWMAEWLTAARPKMAENFTAFVFCDADASVRLHEVMTSTGWPVLRQVIWHRPNLAKKRSGSLTFLSAYEPFWHAGTRALNMPDAWGEERFDVQRVTVPQSNHVVDPSYHPTQKPLELMRRLVLLGSDLSGLVIDPFSGSGTTAVAAVMEGRKYLVGDQSPEYVQITRARLAEVMAVEC